jgi:hypothetical protein
LALLKLYRSARKYAINNGRAASNIAAAFLSWKRCLLQRFNSTLTLASFIGVSFNCWRKGALRHFKPLLYAAR